MDRDEALEAALEAQEADRLARLATARQAAARQSAQSVELPPQRAQAPEPQVVRKEMPDALIQPVQQQPVSPPVGWRNWTVKTADAAVQAYASALEEALGMVFARERKAMLAKIALLESRLALLERARAPERSPAAPPLRVVGAKPSVRS